MSAGSPWLDRLPNLVPHLPCGRRQVLICDSLTKLDGFVCPPLATPYHARLIAVAKSPSNQKQASTPGQSLEGFLKPYVAFP
jgi:hypothetical protein